MVALGKTTLTARGMAARMIGYARKYWHWAFLAVLTMGFEVWADLMIPSVMSRLVDDGILGQAGGGPDAGAIARYGLIMAAVAAAGAVAGVGVQTPEPLHGGHRLLRQVGIVLPAVHKRFGHRTGHDRIIRKLTVRMKKLKIFA